MIEVWARQFGEAWANKDVDAVMSLFAQSELTYYENALNEPIRDWNEVKQLWNIVPNNQKDIAYQSSVVAETPDGGIIHWQMSRTLVPSNEKQVIDGLFEVKLNKFGECTFFKQWRSVKSL